MPKDAALLEVCGDLDELGALLGVARCDVRAEPCNALLEQVQRRLFDIGTELVAVASGQVAAPARPRSPLFRRRPARLARSGR